jgi:hypothetical protein
MQKICDIYRNKKTKFMETTKIDKAKLNLFVLAGKQYVNSFQKKKSKLWVAIDTVLPKATKLLERVEKEKELARVNQCKKSASKHIEYDKNGRYQFTEEAYITLQTKLDAIDEAEVAIPKLIVPKGEYPELGLSYDHRQAFQGIVIPEPDYKLDDPKLDAKLEEENNALKVEIEEREEEPKAEAELQEQE